MRFNDLLHLVAFPWKAHGRPPASGFVIATKMPDSRPLSKPSDQFQSIHTPVSREWGEEDGDNPVFIDGKKCWWRFRFGTVGMYDPYNCPTLEEFHHRVFPPAEDLEDSEEDE